MTPSLLGKRILITREKAQATKLIQLIRKAGGIPCPAPLLRFEAIFSDVNEERLKRIHKEADWLFFTSANTVRFFEQYKKRLGLSFRQKIAVVGEKTAEVLKDQGYSIDFQPSIYSGSSMVPEFIQQFGTTQTIALICGTNAREEIPQLLRENDVSFQQIAIYRTIKNEEGRQMLFHCLKQDLDACLFTSPSTVKVFIEFAESEHLEKIKKETVSVAIGQTTADELEEQGFCNIIFPKTYTIEDMVKRTSDYFQTKG